MIPIRRLLLLLVCVSTVLSFGCLAEEMPAWTYPLEPELLADPQDYILLTNTSALLDPGYMPQDLKKVTAKRASSSAMELRQEANEAIQAMFAAAQADGYTLYVKSAYRSYQTQKSMYHNRVDRMGYDDGLVAYPGSSDHQTGLGVDILNYEWTQKDGMNEKFAQTAEAQWMAQHCQEFGFILRYMEDKEESTGIKYEPWHFRYVGLEAAQYIMENHLSLEEFDREWRAYVAEYEAAGGNFQELLARRRQTNGVTIWEITESGEEELSIFY